MTVFMLIVADMVPASSETIPLLGIFFTCVMVEMVLMVSSMGYILKLYLKTPAEGETIPDWMRRYGLDYTAGCLKIKVLIAVLEKSIFQFIQN